MIGCVWIFQDLSESSNIASSNKAINTQAYCKIAPQFIGPFSQEGSTCYLRENQVYASFVKFLREVSSSRRDGITFSHVLVFVMGASKEPVLGFVLHPSIKFTLCKESSKVHVNHDKI